MESNSNVPVSWTNEKHVQFLNTMEASFVCSMIENKGRLTRLDRYMPDTSDSTLDRIKTTPKTTITKRSDPERKMSGKAVRKTRRLASQPFISSQMDQVVPQFEIAVVGDKVSCERWSENKHRESCRAKIIKIIKT